MVEAIPPGSEGPEASRLRTLPTVSSEQDAQTQVFRSLADHSLEFIGICDLEFNPYYVNEAGRRLVGLASSEEARALKVQDCFFPEDRTYINETFFPLVQREGHGEVEIRFRHFKTGAAVWVIYNVFQVRDAQGRVSGYATVSRDITERKKTEETLRRSEATWSAAIESFAEGAIIATEDEQVIYWNAAARAMHGLRGATDGVGPLAETPKTFELWTPDDTHQLTFDEWPMRRIKRGETVKNLELRLRRPEQGWERTVSYSGSMVDTTRGDRLIFLSVHDLTEQRSAESELRRTKQMFQAVVDKAPAGIAMVNERGEFLVANRALGEILGWPPTGTVHGPEANYTVHASDGSAFPAERLPMARALKGEDAGEVELVIRRQDGSDAVVLCAAAPLRTKTGTIWGAVATMLEITARKRTEAALRVSEERFRIAQDLSPDGFTILKPVRDAAGAVVDFTWVYENAAVARLNGTDTHAIIGRSLLEVFPSHRGTEMWRAYREVADGGEQRVLEVHYGAETVKPTWFRLVVVPLGKDIAVVAQDITQQKAFANELQRLVEERTARLQDLVGELEHFSYTITHDLKAPLRAMRGFADLANTACIQAGTTAATEFLSRISTSAERMDHLISDALNYSRSVREELPLEPVDAGALLQGMLDSYPELQAEHAHIRVDGNLPTVLANQAGLTQIFSNLLGNAVKFVRRGEKPAIHVWADRRKEWVRFWVEDHGIGIPKSILPRIFEMFSRGSKEYDGTGIGLALVRKVVQRMGGRLGVESEEGKGSRFWFELQPSVSAGSPNSIISNAPSGAAPPGRILYVEDEEHDRAFMEFAFSRKGQESMLYTVNDGQAAIDYLAGEGRYANRSIYPLPILALVDLNLPRVPGFEVLKWIRNHADHRQMPVVIFSSSTREDDRIKAQALGATEILTKPNSAFEFDEIVEALQSLASPLKA